MLGSRLIRMASRGIVAPYGRHSSTIKDDYTIGVCGIFMAQIKYCDECGSLASFLSGVVTSISRRGNMRVMGR